MNLNWSNRVIKYVLFIFNLLFVISGIIMIAVGVSVKSYYTDYDIFLNDSYFSLPNLLIATGSLIFFISFFGCCGAVKESWFMIFIFAILLSLIFILEFSAGIAGYVLRDKTSSYLTDSLKASMENYLVAPDQKPSPTTIMWDNIQYEFECCGAVGPTDWLNIIKGNTVKTTSNQGSTTLPVVSSSVTTTSNQGTTVPSGSTPHSTVTASSVDTSSTIGSLASTIASNATGKKKREAEPEVTQTGDLPGSCCKSNPGATGTITCSVNNTLTATYYKKGCVEGFGDYLKDHAVTLGGVGLAIAFIQLFAVIFACHLARQLKHGFYST